MVVVLTVPFTNIFMRKPFLVSEPSLAKRAFRVKGSGRAAMVVILLWLDLGHNSRNGGASLIVRLRVS